MIHKEFLSLLQYFFEVRIFFEHLYFSVVLCLFGMIYFTFCYMACVSTYDSSVGNSLSKAEKHKRKDSMSRSFCWQKNLGLQLRLNVDCRIYNIVKCAKRSSRLEDAAAAAAALISIHTLYLFSSQRVTTALKPTKVGESSSYQSKENISIYWGEVVLQI